MKICSVCHHCYEDTASICPQVNHGNLIPGRSGTRKIAAQYRLDVLLERNVTGETYQASNVGLNQSLVIRLIPLNLFGHVQQMLERLNNVQAATLINHPNVASIYDYGVTEENEFYLATEELGGQTLQERLKTAGSLSEATAIMIARQAAEGLEAAHSAGVIHRSLNPTNIILLDAENDSPLIKIQNFDYGGILQQIVTTNISAAEPYLDTLRYLSPEQCARQTIDERTDIYSLGMVLYEMLSGKTPFDAPTPTAIVNQINHEQPKLLNHLRFDVRALLTHILARSLKKNPALRPPTAANLARHLRHLEYITRQSPAFSQKSMVANASSNGQTMPTARNVSENALATEIENLFVAEEQTPSSTLMVEPVALVNSTGLSSPGEPVKNIEEEMLKEFESGFEAEPISAQSRDIEQIPVFSEAILVTRKDFNFSQQVENQILLKTEDADTAQEILAQPIIPNASNSLLFADVATRKYVTPKRSVAIIFGIIAILITAIFGALLINRQWQSESQATQTPATPAINNEQPSLTVNEKPTVAATIETQSSTALERDNKNQPSREETLTTNNAKTSKPVSKDISAVNKPLLPEAVAATNDQPQTRKITEDGESQAELNSSLNKWIKATNERDVDGQMNYYAPKVNAYYQARNASLDTVRAEKKRVFENASAVSIQADKPEIAVSNDGQTAKMRFRKKYVIKNGGRNRSGEVIQELQWVKSRSGWKIVSERDVKVINHP